VNVQVGEQLFRVAEVPIEINLGEEQRQVLEVLRVEEGPGVVSPLRDPLPMVHDVLVVGQKQIIRKIRSLLRWDIEAKGVVEASHVVLVEALQLRRLQLGGKMPKARHAEQAEQPLVKH